ncbi:MAG: M20/M25/M40 family metallo-hydrolase [Gemmatimonadaceae bacterium]|nr:M20/M25/M40 family metallo-hydrolase [Gemmatimonadaceae bacterium]
MRHHAMLAALLLPLSFTRPPAPRSGVAPAAADSLSRVERALARHALTHEDEALALLERLVNINSGTQNLVGVREVGRVLRAEYDALGFTTRWVDGAAFGRAGHLVAERTGVGPRVLLIGHLDTVFESDSPFQRWTRLSDSTVRGPGATDMKGGDVVMLQALKALQASGQLARMNITVVLTGDEEEPGEPIALARQALVEAGARAQVAIGFEDGDGDPRTAVAARRGFTGWTLHVTGTPAHSSQVFRADIGPGAIYEAARLLNEFRLQLGGDPLRTFNAGVALGGTTITLDSTGTRGTAFGKSNVIPEHFTVTGDLRVISPEAVTQAKARMQAIVATAVPHTTATLTFDDGYPPMAPTEGNRALLAAFDRASRDLGFGPVGMDNPARAGAADVSFIAATVPQVIDGLGPGGTGGHTVHETLLTRTVAMQVARTAVLLHRVTRAAVVK